ncbi:SDR family NAD(P)-dependent oxidoreductase [Rhodobacteraceae bacterium 2CG4]|uniref:SDR family NAD(P)-dependent oxidoreductase n=1 Tax=Halovulum marinum TaxID=2662447 RepID=A0A6L5YY18_9RHOB|nr:SDR family oxidoreductase [Halovulum marinum]MSU88752.1 SDR family NAD(P)-dependent oxidoreductase [Halovulum marinum]
MTQTAIVTGAGSGIGAATARAFLEAGYNVALLGRREAPLQDTAQGHERALCLPTDVTDDAAVDAAFDKAAARFGRIDVLFNNAGTNTPGRPIDEIGVDEWRQVIDVNLTGAFLCARAAFRHMRAQDPQGGRIINNGSISAHVPRPGSVPYTASKHAISGLTKTLSLDGRRFNIACGQVDIGNALTDMAARMVEGVPQADGAIKAEPVMKAGDVARAVVHMASLPLDTNIQTMTIMASAMPYIGRG